MTNADIVKMQWPLVLAMMPADLEETASSKLAIVRRRGVGSAADLLRLALLYGFCGLSLRQTAARASLLGLGELSDVAVLHRLEKAADWLGSVVVGFLRERGLTHRVPALSVQVVDATTISRPGSRGTDWRLHVGLDLAEERISEIEVTGVEGGETLDRHEVKPGQVVLADRGYAHREAVAGVFEAGGHVVVRLSRNSFPLENRRGKALDLPGCMEGLQIGEMGDWDVQFEAGGRKYEGRLVALRQSEAVAEHERKRIRRVASHKGRKLEARSLKAAGFLYVFTDLPREVLPTAEALELYRLRWQIEIVFKRLKSVLDLDGLRAKNPDLARAYLYAKILGALVAQELCQDALAFFPWGYALFAEQRQSLAVASDGGGGGEDGGCWDGACGRAGDGNAEAAASRV
jgi:hypothetical protein